MHLTEILHNAKSIVNWWFPILFLSACLCTPISLLNHFWVAAELRLKMRPMISLSCLH